MANNQEAVTQISANNTIATPLCSVKWKMENKKIAITFDIDWAPDFMIENAVNLFRQGGGESATLFVTHCSKYIRSLMNQPDKFGSLEIGLHPYMANLDEKGLLDLKNEMENFYGCAIVSSRFHRLAYSYRDLYQLGSCGIKYDYSYLTFLQSLLFKNQIDDNIVQLPYHFEDGTYENMGIDQDLFCKFIDQQELVNVTFHPLNIYLNTSSFEQRTQIFAKIGHDLLTLSVERAESYVKITH